MDGNSYFVLIPLPLAVAFVLFIVSYILGLRLISSIGIGVFFSVIAVIAIHPFQFDQGVLVPETGDMYTSIYVISGLLISLISICYAICKNKSRTCCCKEDYTYDVDANSLMRKPEESREVIEHYSDVIESTIGPISSDIESQVHPAFKHFTRTGILIPKASPKQQEVFDSTSYLSESPELDVKSLFEGLPRSITDTVPSNFKNIHEDIHESVHESVTI